MTGDLLEFAVSQISGICTILRGPLITLRLPLCAQEMATSQHNSHKYYPSIHPWSLLDVFQAINARHRVIARTAHTDLPW